MTGAPSFMDLVRVHEELDETFLLHQEALMAFRPLEALGWIRRVEEEIAAHVRDEEAILLPVYAARAGLVKGGAAEIFVAEHRKIQTLLEEFGDAAASMVEAAPSARDILRLLDREFVYKQLMEHHDLREKRFLYPILDRVTTPEERREVFARLERPR